MFKILLINLFNINYYPCSSNCILIFNQILFSSSLINVLLSLSYIQRQHHHQYNQLRDQRVCRFCHFLHPGVHGTPPERPGVRGGRPWPWAGLCGLPRSPHSASHFSTLVAAVLLHAHPSGTGDSGEAGKLNTTRHS